MNMSPSARYVTQSRIWDNHVLGRLTDRKIQKYQDAGYYSGNAPIVRTNARRAQRNKRVLLDLKKLLGYE